MEKFLKVVGGKVVLMNIYGNKIRTYYSKTDALRADWFSEKDETVIIQLSSGKSVIINKNASVVRTI